MDNLSQFLEKNNIEQVHISPYFLQIAEPFQKKYKLKKYSDQQKQVLFFGLQNPRTDINAILSHYSKNPEKKIFIALLNEDTTLAKRFILRNLNTQTIKLQHITFLLLSQNINMDFNKFKNMNKKIQNNLETIFIDFDVNTLSNIKNKNTIQKMLKISNSNKEIEKTYLLYLDPKRKDFLKKYLLDNFNELKDEKLVPFRGRPKEEFFTHEIQRHKRSPDIKILLNKLQTYKGSYKTEIINFRKKYNVSKLLQTDGQYGHLDSFQRIIENAIENNYENILILEDDIFLHKNINNLFDKTKFDEIQSRANIIYFGAMKYGGATVDNKNFNARHIDCTCAVYLNQSVFHEYLELLKLRVFASDTCLHILQQFYSTYVYEPNLIISDLSDSYITSYKNKEQLLKQFGWNEADYNLWDTVQFKKENIDQNEIKIKELKKYLENKTVIIVGPAEYNTEDSKYSSHIDYNNKGEFIDSFDIVVRCNKGHNMIKEPTKFGSRTDILYHCVSQTEYDGGKIDSNNSKFVRLAYPPLNNKESPSFPYGNRNQYKEINHSDNKISYVLKQSYIKFENELETRPNCGTIAIWDLLQHNIKSLYVTGFTLWQTKYSELYKKTEPEKILQDMKRYNTHDQEKIAKYYFNKILTNPKIKYDNQFEESINKNLLHYFENGCKQLNIIDKKFMYDLHHFSKIQEYIDKNVIVYGLYYNNQLSTHKHITSKIYKKNLFNYVNDINLTKNPNRYNFLDNKTTVIIDGLTSICFKTLFYIFTRKDVRIIGTIYLTDMNDNENKYLEIYNQYKVPIYIDNYFIYKRFKNKIPINLHLPLFKHSKPVKYKNKKIFFSKKRLEKENDFYEYFELLKKKHNFAEININNFDNEFKESSIIIIKEDHLNDCRTSKKLFDSIIDNKIILIENKDNCLVSVLKYINYPNFIFYNDLKEIDQILTDINIHNIKYFDSRLLKDKFVIYDDSESIFKYKLFIRSQSQKVILLGNGPSCKHIDFKKINCATIGMNVAFRHWYKINWFPDIYCCLDVELLKCHFSAISELIKNKKCQKFFLRKHFQSICKKNNIEILEENVYYLEDMEHILFESNKHITTGSYALRFALFLGYIDIRLIGIDSNYINYVENCEKKNNSIKSTALEIKYDKPSVNYFFDDYQKKGDVYNVPNVDKDFKCECKYCNGNIMNHKDLHNKVFDFIIKDKEDIKEYQNVSIKNYSEISQLKQFKKEKIELIYN